MKQRITIRTPGKLMVAGEFAVLEPYQKSIVMAVDRFVSCTITDHHKNNLTLNDFKLYELDWRFDGQEVKIDCTDSRVSFVKDAMTITYKYLQEQSNSTTPVSLAVNSELDDKESGVKYGLGSSAAVVTSVITAILTKFLGGEPSREMIFKLAAISHIRTQGTGSGADIAASTYGGVLLYSSFQAEWLKNELETESKITKIIEKDWKYLSIRKVRFPSRVKTCIGWTGNPASTVNLVNKISIMKEESPERYEAFLHGSRKAVELIINGMKHDDSSVFLKGIQENGIVLAELGQQANVELETEKLYTLRMEANKIGGAGKLSGAGGGDCGIAFINKGIHSEDLHKAWLDNGIQPLKLAVFPDGAHQENLE